MPRKTNLPPPRTSFHGREGELGQLGALFDGGDWLVTLLGPAGTGKTRTAMRFAELRVGEYPGGVWFCDLTEARDLHGVLAAIGDGLDVPLPTLGDVTSHLGVTLAERGRILLVLDNCEQVVESVADVVARFRDLANEARFLATSREVLKLSGERIYELPPLSLPESDIDAAASEAVHLFVDRARMVRSGYLLRPEARATVAQIVRKLDGLPLAIELAAARVALLGENALLAHLPRRFELLDSGPRGASERQRTLRGAIDWSWQLLQPWEQTALAQCSVFRGGFTLELAQQVLDLSMHAGAPSHLDVLQALRDKSLVRAYEDPELRGELRLGMYESIREYAAEKLAACGLHDATRTRHTAAYLQAATSWAHAVDVAGGRAEVMRLKAEIDNLLAVHERAIEGRAAEEAMRAMEMIAPWMQLRGPADRYMSLLDATLALRGEGAEASRMRARLLYARADARMRFGLPAQAKQGAEETIEAAKAAGDHVTEGRALSLLGRLQRHEGKTDECKVLLERARALLHANGARLFEARVMGELGNLVCDQGDFETSRELFGNALAIFREAGAVRDEGLYRINLGIAFHREMRFEEATTHYLEAVASLREIGARRWVALGLDNYGLVQQELGEMSEARACLDESLSLYRELGDRWCLGAATGDIAGLSHELGNLDAARATYDEAARLLGAAGRTGRAMVALSARASIDAARGRLDDASRDLDAAEGELRAQRDELLLAAVLVYRGHLDLARGQRREAELRLKTAEPSCARSDEVRLAVRVLRRALDQSQVQEAPSSTRDPLEADADALLVDVQSRWFRPPHGTLVDLTRRESLRRILAELVKQRTSHDGEPVSVPKLLACGWPGESMSPRSGAARVYTALSTLRKLGLRDILRIKAGEHYLSPKVRVLLLERDRRE